MAESLGVKLSKDAHTGKAVPQQQRANAPADTICKHAGQSQQGTTLVSVSVSVPVCSFCHLLEYVLAYGVPQALFWTNVLSSTKVQTLLKP